MIGVKHMSTLIKPFNMIEILRQEYVHGAVESVKYLENFSNNEIYQNHIYHIVSWLKLT